MNDAHDYRLLLERAVITDFDTRAPEATVQRMRADTEIMLRGLARKPDDRKALVGAVEAARNIHEEIIDFRGNAIVSHHYRLNSARIRLFRSATYRSTITELITSGLRQDLRVLDACERRDAKEAARLIAEDIETSRSTPASPFSFASRLFLAVVAPDGSCRTLTPRPLKLSWRGPVPAPFGPFTCDRCFPIGIEARSVDSRCQFHLSFI